MVKILPYLILLAAFQLKGQDSLVVTKNFRFTDGVYLSLEEFQSNTPAFVLADLELSFFTNPQTSLTQVESIRLKKDGQLLDPEKIWGLSIDGIPYLRVPKGEIHKELTNFAALKLRGKICYFTYPDWRMKKIQVAAYNPLTGRPFRVGVVEREEEIIIERVLRFDTGEIADFTISNLMTWIQDDPLLVETIQELTTEEQQDRLFKCLLIYVDRNRVYLRKKIH